MNVEELLANESRGDVTVRVAADSIVVEAEGLNYVPKVQRETKKQRRRARQQQEAREEQARADATDESALPACDGDAGSSMAVSPEAKRSAARRGSGRS